MHLICWGSVAYRAGTRSNPEVGGSRPGHATR